MRPPPFRLRIRWKPLRDLLGFGGGQTAAGIANYFANQGDYIVVGRFLDAAALGFYTRAYELIRYPSLIFNNIFGTVLFSLVLQAAGRSGSAGAGVPPGPVPQRGCPPAGQRRPHRAGARGDPPAHGAGLGQRGPAVPDHGGQHAVRHQLQGRRHRGALVGRRLHLAGWQVVYAVVVTVGAL